MSELRTANDLEPIDRAHLFHPGTHLADFAAGTLPQTLITSAHGITVRDQEGRELIDGFAGLYCVNVGYGRAEIADAVHEQMSRMNYYHSYAGFSNEPAIKLSKRIADMAGLGLRRVFYGMSGSDANETQVKLVWYYNNVLGRPQKKKIIARERAYHGSGLMTGSLTGLKLFHRAFDLPLASVLRTSAPHYWRDAREGESEVEYARRLADDLDALLRAEGPETVAAFIAEPVIGSGGIVPPPAGYWQEIQKVLRAHDVLLIADEVVTGFGRTGSAFACQHYGIEPDLMTVAKGISSGYLPLSGVLVSERVWEVLAEGTRELGSFGHGWTYSAHPVCAAAANANLDIIEREGLIENARLTGAYLQDCLKQALGGHPMVGEIRGVGLLAAVEFVAARQPRELFDVESGVAAKVNLAAREAGLLARAIPDQALGLAPPLTVTRGDVDRMVEIVAASISKVHAAL